MLSVANSTTSFDSSPWLLGYGSLCYLPVNGGARIADLGTMVLLFPLRGLEIDYRLSPFRKRLGSIRSKKLGKTN